MVSTRRAAVRKTRPDPPDLPADPQGLDPAPARLEAGADWDGVRAGPGSIVAEVAVGARLREVHWEQADLVGRDLRGLRGQDVTFQRCDLAGAILDGAVLDRVAFLDCRMTGIVLSGATLTDVTCSGGQARQANFRMARTRYFLADSTSLAGASFYSAVLADTRFYDCDLTGIELTGATFTGVELHGSVVDGVIGVTSLDGVVVESTQMVPLGLALLTASGARLSDERT